MKTNTVNVIEIDDDSVVRQLFAFVDDAEGNKEAEKVFARLVNENGGGSELKMFLEDGIFAKDGWVIMLVHSTN